MSTHFEFTVPLDGTIPVVLPEEFRGKKVAIVTEGKDRPKPCSYDDSFYHPKSLEEIIAEQGKKPIEDISELCPEKPLWDSDEEFFKFLEAVDIDPENYRSIEYLSNELPE